MSRAPLRGLTWDHPRGYAPLEAAARSANVPLSWQRQPLEGFESHPLVELARDYDLLVIDHPHVGEAAASGALRPLDDLLAQALPAVGRSSESYAYAGRQWALPLDASAQVGVARAELEAPFPATWAEAVTLARRVPATLPLAGPHALLGLFAIATAFGDPPGRGPGGSLFAGDGAREAWEVLARFTGHCGAEAFDQNPIAVLERLARAGEPLWCPLVYAYVTYASGAGGRRPLRFYDAPAASGGGLPGSILGGTGVALSALRPPSPAAGRHAADLASALQLTAIPAAGGQPAARAAWSDATLDRAAGGFYSATSRTLEHAIVRPRFAGFVHFQSAGSQAVRRALRSGERATTALAELEALYAEHRPDGAEI